MKKQTVRARKYYRSYVEILFVILFIGLTLRWFVVTPYKISGDTMSPTLLAGDYVFVWKLPYGLRIPFVSKIGRLQKPRIGDIVLFSSSRDPGSLFIKRIRGISEKEVILTVDNPNLSDSSQNQDIVPIENIEGKVVVVWLSYDIQTRKIRWERFFLKHL